MQNKSALHKFIYFPARQWLWNNLHDIYVDLLLLNSVMAPALLNTCFNFGRLNQAGRDLANVCRTHNFLLNLRTFFFPEKNVYLWPQHQGTFSSAWMLEFWPIDEFQGKFKTNWRVLKNRRNAFYRISLRNITAHVLLTAFVTSIFTFVHTFINLFVQSQYRNMLIINQWAAWNYSLIRVINTLSVGFYTAPSQNKNT